MAQPATFRSQFLGAVSVKANKEYNATDFTTLFPSGSIFVLKTRAKTDKPITVSINGTVGFPIEYNEASAYDGATSLKYVFSQDCIIAVSAELVSP